MPNLSTTELIRMQGLSGEEQKMHVSFQTEGQARENVGKTIPGIYRVDFLLAQPNRSNFQPGTVSFIKDLVGDSHLKIAKHISDRSGDDVESMLFVGHFGGATIDFKCITNDDGRIGRITTENVWATDHVNAEFVAYRALAPFLSAWSASLDIPLTIETIQVTDPRTYTESLRVMRPFREMAPHAGTGAKLSPEYLAFASVYREALNSYTPFYRYLCFYKIIESIYAMRSDAAAAATRNGQVAKKNSEDTVKLTVEAVQGMLSWIYPWEDIYDSTLSRQILQREVLGKKFRTVYQDHLRPLRDSIAHALMETGTISTVADKLEDVENVTRWLPLLRLWSRVLLKSEFPDEFLA